MSQIYQKADSSIFSDMSSSKSYISYPHTSYQCSQFNNSHSDDQNDSKNNSCEFKSDDDSSNDNSFEEMDAVKRFCNLSKPIESNGTEHNSVNNDNTVHTFPSVDNCLDNSSENVISHNEDLAAGNIESSSGNNLDESNSCTDLSENLPDKICSDPNINENSSDLILENSIVASRNTSDQTLSTTLEHQILEKPSDDEIISSNGDLNSATIEVSDNAPTIVSETECGTPIDDCSFSSSLEKQGSESPNRAYRPVRKRPPSLKLIEAAGGLISAKDYTGKMMGKVLVKQEPPTDPSPMPTLVSAADLLPSNPSLSSPPSHRPPPPNVTLPPPVGPQLKTTTTEFQATPTIKDGNMSPWPVLGEGWIKKEVMRRNGLSAGRYDIYYISPEGVKVRSKPELQLLVGEALDLSNFNFRLGQFLTTLNGRPNSKRKKRSGRLPEIPDLVVAEEKETPATMITNPDSLTTPPNSITSSPNLMTSSLSPVTSPEEPEEYKEKLVRCKRCENCVRENCGQCVHCKDMRQFGGSNSRRQSCVLRKCNQGVKVKIAVKGKRPRETTPISSCKKPRMFGLQSTEGLQTPTASIRQSESAARPAHIPSSALQKYINLSLVPKEFNLPVNHMLSVKIGDKTHACPLLWIDDLFHQQTLLHYDKNVRNATIVPPPPVWPVILTNFYNFTFQFTVTLNDVEYQFNVVEKCKVQTKKVCQYVRVYGSHVRDVSVDIHFYQFLESVELYQYLPNHPKNVAENNNQQKSMDDEMNKICGELTDLINNNPRLEEGLRKLLLKYLATSDLCTFILAVVNSNTVPADFEAAVVEILRRDLNLQDISNLTDLTGLSLTNQPEVAAVETVAGNSSDIVPAEKPDINKTLSSLVPDDSPINEEVRNFILNEPLKVIEMINELQKSPGKPLSFETLSKMILEISKPKAGEVVHIKTERIEPASVPRPLSRPPVLPARPPVVVSGKVHNVTIPRVTVPYPHSTPAAQFVAHVKHPTPPGYNPRYYTPHLSPQHQQRYGRPPLRRAAPNLGAIQHIAAPVIPGPKTGPRVRDIRKIAPPTVLVSKGVQVKPAQRTVQQQVSLKPVPKARARKEKFVDLDFCPHV